MPSTSRQRLRRTLPALGLLALITLVFWPALSGGFVFDDYPIFAENPIIHVTGWHWQAWQQIWAWSHINIQRPLAMLSYALNYALGSGTWGFKATNLAIHLLNTVLLLLLTRRLLSAGWSSCSDKDVDIQRRHTDYWALGIATAWAIHPLQISAVMYVVQRMELMGFTFTLLALLAYWHVRQQQLTGQRSWPYLLLCSALTVIGYYFKETAVLVPGYALLLELTVLRFAADRPLLGRTWKITYAIGCLMALTVFVFYLLPHYATTAAYDGRDYTAWQRELTQLRVLPMYLGWCVLPLPDQLHFYYDNYVASSGLLHPITTLLGGLLLLCLLGLAIAMRHRRPLLALGIGWFFMAHALTSSPLPLELVFEHRNYPALFGVLLAVTDLLWLATRHLHPRLPAILASIFILNLGFLTALRAATWSSPLQLATALADSNPGSMRAALDLARRYVAMSQNDPSAPLYSLGIKELERATKLPTSSILPEESLLIQAANHPGMASQPWWSSLQRKLQTRPMGPDAYHALFGLFEASVGGNTGIDAQQLARSYEIAIARAPSRIGLHVQYAELAGSALHDPTLAIEQWKQALQLQKDVPGYANQLA
ncbi:MAG: hypothetical protein WA777_15545, partial [Rhodanobacter sp.]